MKGKVIFVGAGPGDPDLITVKGRNVIENADVIIYAGSLVNKNVLCPAKEDCEIHNSAYLKAIETVQAVLPDAKHVGVFETAFHRDIPMERKIYGIPYEWYETYGVKKTDKMYIAPSKRVVIW